MIDVSREYFDIHFIMTSVLQSMSMSKINVLHLHITDDDTNPLQLPSFPDITKYSAWSDKEVYTAQEMKDLVKEATTYGIKVIPEFDLPSHAHAFGRYPDLKPLVLCMDRHWGYTYPDKERISGGPNSGALNPALTASHDFIKKLYKDIISIWPESDMIHFGGDEVILDCWNGNKEINDFKTKNGIKSN